MTPRQFAVLQHLEQNGWDLPVNISAAVFGTPHSTACSRVLTLMARHGWVESATKKYPKPTTAGRSPRMIPIFGWQLTDAGEAALVAENLRLLKEVADPGRRPRAAPWIIKVPK